MNYLFRYYVLYTESCFYFRYIVGMVSELSENVSYGYAKFSSDPVALNIETAIAECSPMAVLIIYFFVETTVQTL